MRYMRLKVRLRVKTRVAVSIRVVAIYLLAYLINADRTARLYCIYREIEFLGHIVRFYVLKA